MLGKRVTHSKTNHSVLGENFDRQNGPVKTYSGNGDGENTFFPHSKILSTSYLLREES